ncbi:hypothetical protein [Burkholderia ubonensis]|uniref:hypothetical protein n=1 Tax=Burkholderia ubonensis TaxID=101571 RepID=UPI00075B1674|nr:hypothetical protein [Burkholderia ubonensis]KVS40476.1 hypothetical protein WK37_21515 [Burkholderia ubonensis]KVS51096.1 hypothetical protein WK38_12465 [Burkholderia ubonensis]KVS76101.1 hypothetical protein WK42_18105 [Burkholderia ubonensis]KVS78339.1 hypothetical protein WK43_02345 [Burkholderia ubonensis]KVS82243.1 hypothetical protein WK44_25170 [Burkholderia ubonensis]
MATRFNKGLTGRPFGAALLSIAELRAWLARGHRELETDPPLATSGFIQVEVLLCDIERAAMSEYAPDEAQAIVDDRPDIAVREIVDGEPLEEVPTWIIASERHLFWRKCLGAAIERKELVLLDPVTKQPIGRQANGATKTSSGRNKLTKEQRSEIVQREKKGEKHQALADEFGVTRQAVDKLCNDAKPPVATPFSRMISKSR